MSEVAKVGETWEIDHRRKGRFTARILTDPAGGTFDAEVVAGRARMLSRSNSGEVGDVVTCSTDFVTFLRRVSG